MKLLALDIGGANIKAAWGEAHTEGASGVSGVRAASLPFALWRAPAQLLDALREAAARLPEFDALALTMTGELCDCFESRREGVEHILAAAERLAQGRPLRAWQTDGRFVPRDAAEWRKLASSNWHAQAVWVAQLFPHGATVLIDTGSTTTDIELLRHGALAPRGLDDWSRRMLGSLVYTGARRTSLLSLSPVVLHSGGDLAMAHEPLLAEHFATTGDVYVLTGDLPEDLGDCDTADGRPLTRVNAARRVLRMLGTDLETHASQTGGAASDQGAVALAVQLARACAAVQQDRIAERVRALIERSGPVDRVVVTGSGDFIARRAAERAAPGVEIVRLADRIGRDESTAACAVALLHLWKQ